MWMKREVQVGPSIFEKISLSTFGRNKEPLEGLVHAAMEHRIARELNRIAGLHAEPVTTTSGCGRGWATTASSIQSCSRPGRRKAILEDLDRFFASHARYERWAFRGVAATCSTARRATGKTSLVTAIASELALNVCVLSLASPNVTDEKIGNLLSSVPQRSVILIEDVDAFFRQRDKADTGVKVSYSGFINALDGVAAHEARSCS